MVSYTILDANMDITSKFLLTGPVGLTETSTVVCASPVNDIWFGSSGSLVPSTEARIVTIEGNEITDYDQPGELVIRSPSVVLGYLNNEQATRETFQDEWMRTGDAAVVRKAPSGNEHIWIVDRIKELIKVKVWRFYRKCISWSIMLNSFTGFTSCTCRA